MRVLITGITGQTGSYMADLLLEKGYEVWGLVRRSSSPNWWRIEHIKDEIHFVEGDLSDQHSLDAAIKIVEPNYIFNYASQSFVGLSWTHPEMTVDVTGLGCLRLLEVVRRNCPEARVFQAGSSEEFGNQPAPQNEETPLRPVSPYGCAKTLAHDLCRTYRESYGMFICCGISFNHESPRRGEEFVTRKISIGVSKIKNGLERYITLGNLDSKRDWGYAADYVKGHLLMLQEDKPEDFVFATGETHFVKEFLILAFKYADIDNWFDHIVINDKFKRPTEVRELRGDATKARTRLGWQPKTNFKELVKLMVEADLNQPGAATPTEG